jgi:hypothetical protein
MIQPDRIEDYLRRLTPSARSSLLTELERLEVCGADMPGGAAILQKLRAEFRQGGQAGSRVANPSRYFFMPLELLLVDGAPDHANSGRILRGSLAPIWQWISRDLLPTMARDYIEAMTPLIAADNQRQAREVADAFQTKVVKSLENTLGSADGVAQARNKLATYTSSRFAYEDLTKMLRVLRARNALAKFGGSLPAEIRNFDDSRVSKVTAMLDALGKDHADVIEFALTLVARRLAAQWQLFRLATKAARSKQAADIAATRYAITVSMVLDSLEDRRSALRAALKGDRILVAKEILIAVYDTDFALQVRIEGLEQCDWGKRLQTLMNEIAALVQAEIARFPDRVGHVLESPSLRRYNSLGGRLTYLAWKARDAMQAGLAFFKTLTGQPRKRGLRS